MRITKLTHSCLRIEGAGVLVVDPGEFGEPAQLDGADAVLITHEHPDHLDVDALRAAVERRPELRVFAHAEVLPKLAAFGDIATAVGPGDRFGAAGYSVRAYGGQRALIHADIPRIANLAYLIADEGENVYHPGDSFTVPDDTAVDTLFAPLNAPWMRAMESIDFVRAVQPGRAFALHDGLLNANGAKIYGGLSERLTGVTWTHAAPGTAI